MQTAVASLADGAGTNCLVKLVDYLRPLILQTLSYSVQRGKHDSLLAFCLEIRLLQQTLSSHCTGLEPYSTDTRAASTYLQLGTGRDAPLIQCHDVAHC